MTLYSPFPPVGDAELADLHDRLRRTRWARPLPGSDWTSGTPQQVLRDLVGRWVKFDWRRAEQELAALPWSSARVHDSDIGFLRFDGEGTDAIPIVLTNGWPSSVLELVPLARSLATAVDGLSFTVIVPALPGFPGTPQQSALPPVVPTHELWHRLMSRVLGYSSYLAHGSDLGAGTSSLLAQAHPEAVKGLHLLAAADPPDVDPATLTLDEQTYLEDVARWFKENGAYEHQQMTRPATLAAGLADSPAGLLAWMLEKYHDWTDRHALEISALAEDLILKQASLYWFTNDIATSFRPYFEYAQGHTPLVRRVEVPTALALFPFDLSHPPRSWVERVYDLTRYTLMPRGGHFAASEEPDLLAEDIRAFTRSLM